LSQSKTAKILSRVELSIQASRNFVVRLRQYSEIRDDRFRRNRFSQWSQNYRSHSGCSLRKPVS